MTRVYGISDPTETTQPDYVERLHKAVSTAIDYGLEAIERGNEGTQPVPAELLAQARVAARNGVSLDTVLRRYFAGYTLLGDFVVGGTKEDSHLGADALQSLLRAQASIFERVVAAVTEEYTREAECRLDSAEERRADLVKRLLDGELVDTSSLAYDVASHHLGAIAVGPGASEALQGLAKKIDCRLLLIRRDGDAAWAWFGAGQAIDPAQLQSSASASWPIGVSLAIGEPAYDLAGWRLTHRQALAASPVASRGRQPVVRYAEVALLASMLQDGLLTGSLRELYLAPLAEERDGGAVLRETLRAYCASERNLSSAAAVLGVSRRTVANRLHAVEVKLGRPLAGVMVDIEMALRLEDLEIQN